MNSELKNSEQGFTMIEMLVSIALGLFVLGIAISVFYIQRKTFTLQEDLTNMNQNVRTALDMISGDVRMAGYKVGGTLTVSDASTITFTVGSTTISYNYDNADMEIERDEGAVGGAVNYDPIADNIESLAFTYDTDPNNDITVGITIVGRSSIFDAAYSSDGYRRATMTSSVKIRN